MENDNDVLGYVVCNTCKEPKSVKQGKGKRAKFVFARCTCGLDTRTGKQAQIELKAFKSLEEIQSQIVANNEPLDKPNNEEVKPNNKPNNETVKKEVEPAKNAGSSGTVASVGAGVVVGLFFGGLIKLVKAVA